MKMTMKKSLFTLFAVLLVAVALAVPCFASGGNVSGVIEETWDAANTQIQEVVDNVVFPALSVILAIAFFAKTASAWFDYRKHGQFEWVSPCILFVCLLFCLIAPQFIWKIVL